MQIKINGKVIKIRNCTIEDYRYCYLLTKKNMFPYYEKYKMEWKPSIYRKNFIPKFVKILEHNGKRVGFYKLLLRDGEWYLGDLQISSLLRGKGVGTEVMKFLEEAVKKGSHGSIKLRVFIDNPAVGFYKKIGYKIIENHDNSYVMIKNF